MNVTIGVGDEFLHVLFSCLVGHPLATSILVSGIASEISLAIATEKQS
jgi:hypothetical protein